MKMNELLSAISFGKNVIEENKRERKDIPEWVYQRQIELYEELVEKLLQEGSR